MGESVFQRSFAGGELAPVLHSRADVAKYQQGLRTCRNFFVRREGGVSNRSGFGFVQACKTTSAGTKLMRYVSSDGTGYLIEMGSGYFRFYRNGGPLNVSGVPAWNGATNYVPGDLVVSAGTTYYCHTANINQAPPNGSFWFALTGTQLEIPTPYSLGALPQWNQSGNVITLTQQGQQPRELVFESSTRWILRLISTAASIAAPSAPSGSAGAAGTLTYRYVITAAAADSYEESNASSVATIVNCAEPTPAAPNTLSWTPPSGSPAEYYVYLDPYGNGVFGFVGTASTNSFKDTGFIPDFNLTPPVARNLFQSASNYPKVSARYQQRQFFANTLNEPDSVWGSRTGFPKNFGISSPLQDDDSLTFRVAGNNHHPVEQMVALKAGLVLLTHGGEWTVTGAGGPRSPLTPSSIDALQETYVGVASDVRAVVVGNAVIYVQTRGKIVRDLQFDEGIDGLAGRDLTIYATHLLERKTAVALDFAQVPHSIVWIVRSDGQLLGLTYVPDQDVWGWHRHDTLNGSFEDCCVVPESDEDALYVIVKRTINLQTKRYIERMEVRDLRDGFVHADSFFVDSGLEYSGAPADEFSGLGHLQGQVVAVYGDGQVVFNGNSDGLATAAQLAQFTVSAAGEITLSASYSNVKIGLPIVAQLEPLDLDAPGSSIRDRKKSVQGVTVLVERSSLGFFAGPDAAQLRKYTRLDWETTADIQTGGLELFIPGVYTKHGRFLIQQHEPLPLTILGIMPLYDIGG